MAIFGSRVSDVVASKGNIYKSFFIASNGSKEGWGDNDIGDTSRTTFIKWIEGQAYSDGSNSISYCEIAYGIDDEDVNIEHSN